MEKLTPKQKLLANRPEIAELIAKFECTIIPTPENKTNQKIKDRIETWSADFITAPPVAKRHGHGVDQSVDEKKVS